MQGSAVRRQVRRISRVPPVVWAVTALFGLFLVGWSLLAPMTRAPDEQAHADLVFQQATGAPYPEFDDLRLSTGVYNVFFEYTPGFLEHWLTPETAPDRAARKSFKEWGGARPSQAPNQMPQHPPLYYKATAAVLRLERAMTPGDEPPLETEWLFLRLFNALMVLPVPALAWLAARRLGASHTVALTAATTPLAVPQLTHIGASINNDNLLILLGSILAVLLAGVLSGSTRKGEAVAIGIVTGLALLTKAFALALIPWVVLVYGYQAWRVRAARREAAVGLLISACTAAIVAGWWYVSNLVRYGELSPTIGDVAFASGPAGFSPDPLWYVRRFTSAIIQRFWGDFGWFEAPMTGVVVVAATVVAVAGILAALLVPRRSAADDAPRSTPSRMRLAIYLSVLPLLLVFVARNAYRLYSQSGKTPFMQGRYLFGAIVPFAVVVAVGLVRVLGRWAPLAVLAGAVAMQVDGAGVALRAWWAEPDASVSRSFDAMLAWCPVPSFVVYALLLAIGAAVIGTAYLLSRTARAAGGETRR